MQICLFTCLFNLTLLPHIKHENMSIQMSFQIELVFYLELHENMSIQMSLLHQLVIFVHLYITSLVPYQMILVYHTQMAILFINPNATISGSNLPLYHYSQMILM